MSEHVRDVVLKCAQSLHVINMLRRHGMNDQALQAVYRSVVLAGPVSTRLTGQRQLNSSRTTTTHCSVTS